MIILVSQVRAQYDPYFSHYFDLEPSFNPAAVGKESKLNIHAAYALNFAGFEKNPRTMYVAADMPLYFMKNFHGVGIQLINDQLGLMKHQMISVQYAYKHRLLGGQISIGLQAGMASESFKGSELDLDDTESGTDNALPTSDVTGNGMDLSAGVYYSKGNWYAGLSITHITAPTITYSSSDNNINELKIDPTYYLTGGYNIKLRNPFLTIKPSVLVRTDGVSYRADITGHLVYNHDKKLLYGGLAYSPTNSVTVLVGGNFHGVIIGYSYEVYTSAISIGNGSHELCIGYQTDINLMKKGKNLHKSVRIL